MTGSFNLHTANCEYKEVGPALYDLPGETTVSLTVTDKTSLDEVTGSTVINNSIDTPPAGEFPAWQCAFCHDVCTCSVAEHGGTCPGFKPVVQSSGNGMSLLLEGDGGPTVKVKNITVGTPGSLPYHTGYGVSWAIYGPDGKMVSCQWAATGLDGATRCFAPGGQDPMTPLAAGSYFLATEVSPAGEHVLSNILMPDDSGEAVFPKEVKMVVYEKTDGKIYKKMKFWDGSESMELCEYDKDGKIVPVRPELKNNLEPDGEGGFRRRPRPKGLFDVTVYPREQWAWIVEKSYLQRQQKPVDDSPDARDKWIEWWGDWGKSLNDRPYGFPTRVFALRRMLDLMEKDHRNLSLGIVQYRVQPHFLGYVPKEESWYRETYERDRGPDVRGPLFGTDRRRGERRVRQCETSDPDRRMPGSGGRRGGSTT